MIIFRRKLYSDILDKYPMIKKISKMLDDNREYNYDLEDNIPSDSVSINFDLNNMVINLPLELEHIQYKIDDYVRSLNPSFRTIPEQDRDIVKVKIKGSMTLNQAYKLVKFIIKEADYLVICPKF